MTRSRPKDDAGEFDCCLPARKLSPAVVITIGLLAFHLSFCAARAAEPGQAPQKLILGFEKEELLRTECVSSEANPAKSAWFFFLDQPEGLDFAARFEQVPGRESRVWTWTCRPGEHTQGDLALVARVGAANPQNTPPSYRRTDFLSFYYPSLGRKGEGAEAHHVMTTFQWFSKGRPDLKDWSSYDLLRIDARCDGCPVQLQLALEDDVIEPPVMTTYTLPTGRWITIELDLDAAVAARNWNTAVTRLVRGPYRGRLWASWGEVDRNHAVTVHVKYSDDDGRTWIPWGRGAELPGSSRGWWNDTYMFPVTAITPYGDHVAVFWQHVSSPEVALVELRR